MSLLSVLNYVTWAISIGSAIVFLYLLVGLCKEKYLALKAEVEENEKVNKTAALLTEITRIGQEIENDKKVA